MISSLYIINILEEDGWVCVRKKGDHWHYKKKGNQYLVTVVHPRKDNPIRYIRALEKLTGVHLIQRDRIC